MQNVICNCPCCDSFMFNVIDNKIVIYCKKCKKVYVVDNSHIYGDVIKLVRYDKGYYKKNDYLLILEDRSTSVDDKTNGVDENEI